MQYRILKIRKLKFNASLHAILIRNKFSKIINAFLDLTMKINFWEKIACRKNKLIYFIIFIFATYTNDNIYNRDIGKPR